MVNLNHREAPSLTASSSMMVIQAVTFAQNEMLNVRAVVPGIKAYLKNVTRMLRKVSKPVTPVSPKERCF